MVCQELLKVPSSKWDQQNQGMPNQGMGMGDSSAQTSFPPPVWLSCKESALCRSLIAFC